MNENLRLYKPKLEELSYRQELLSQEDTMKHRKGLKVKSEYYNKDTGCIDFPKDKWESWHAEYVDEYSNLYYAYIVKDDEFIGEASFYKSSDGNSYDVSILIEAKHRRKGYGHDVLNLLLTIAFDDFDINTIEFVLKNDDIAARKLCTKAGFNARMTSTGKYEMAFNKKDYYRLKQQAKMYS